MTERGGGRGGRRRDAAATRAAILEAARRRFSAAGYDRVGVREIAAEAGIDPALVIRYFGSKEALFAEAIARKLDLTELIAGDRATLGERLARSVLAKAAAGPEADPLIALLRSAPSERPGAILRRAIDEQIIGPLAATLPGEERELRAGLISAYLLGLLVARIVIGTTPLVEGDEEALAALIAPVLQAYVDGG